MSEVKELPSGWVDARILDIASPSGSWSPKSHNREDFLYVDVEALDNSTQQITAPKHVSVTNAPSRARIAIKAGDVLFSLVRPYLKNIAVVPLELDGQVASTAYCAVRPEDGIVSKYIFYAFLRDSFINSVITYGDSPPAGHDDEFLAMHLQVAPTSEQCRIVEAIEQQFTRLDAGVAALKRAQAALKRYRAAVLKAAVEGKLTEAWRAAHPEVEPAAKLLERILAERHAKWEADLRAKGKDPSKAQYNEPQRPDTTDLPELPEGWCWARLEQLGEVGTGATPLRSRSQDYYGGSIPWVTSGALNADMVTEAEEYITDQAVHETNAKVFPAGTLLVAMYGEGKTRGKVAELSISAATNQACAAIVFRPLSSVCRPYVKTYLSSNYEDLRRQASGGVQPNLNLAIIRELPLPLPPLTEQEQIVSDVEQRLSVVSELELTLEHNLKRAERLRQSILERAFSGQLVPQDPNDEPASVLLERIRKERNGSANGHRGDAGRKVAAVNRITLWDGD